MIITSVLCDKASHLRIFSFNVISKNVGMDEKIDLDDICIVKKGISLLHTYLLFSPYSL